MDDALDSFGRIAAGTGHYSKGKSRYMALAPATTPTIAIRFNPLTGIRSFLTDRVPCLPPAVGSVSIPSRGFVLF